MLMLHTHMHPMVPTHTPPPLPTQHTRTPTNTWTMANTTQANTTEKLTSELAHTTTTHTTTIKRNEPREQSTYLKKKFPCDSMMTLPPICSLFVIRKQLQIFRT